MKLLNLLVISIAIISSYAFPESDLFKRELSLNSTETEGDKKASDECIMEILLSPYSSKCLPTINLENYETFCNDVYRADGCQQFYKNPLDFYKYCEGVPTIVYSSLIRTELICTMDEDNKICPAGKAIVAGTSEIMNKKDTENMLKETCKSARCTNAFINFNKKLLIGLNDALTPDETLSAQKENEYLESNNCQVKSIFSSQSNKTYYTKMTYSLIISLIFLLFLL